MGDGDNVVCILILNPLRGKNGGCGYIVCLLILNPLSRVEWWLGLCRVSIDIKPSAEGNNCKNHAPSSIDIYSPIGEICVSSYPAGI